MKPVASIILKGAKMTSAETTKLIIVLVLAAAVFMATAAICRFSPPAGGVSSTRSGPSQTFDDLLDAIEWVESKGSDSALGTDGEVGCLQIRKICVKDCNRILGETYFNDVDRFSRVQSRHMAHVYLHHYAKGKSFEDAARIWNGGPNGHKKESTKAYWLKVKARMDNATGQIVACRGCGRDAIEVISYV